MGLKITVGSWILLTGGFSSAYLSLSSLSFPYYQQLKIFLDKIRFAFPDQVIVFRLGGSYEYDVCEDIPCIYISVKAMIGNFTFYVSYSLHPELKHWNSVSSIQGEYRGCIAGLICRIAFPNCKSCQDTGKSCK